MVIQEAAFHARVLCAPCGLRQAFHLYGHVSSVPAGFFNYQDEIRRTPFVLLTCFFFCFSLFACFGTVTGYTFLAGLYPSEGLSAPSKLCSKYILLMFSIAPASG